MIDQQALELLAGVLAALVGMMQQRVRFAATPDRHDQGIGDKLCPHACVHRPANDATGEQVNDYSHVEPAFRRPDIGEVSDPFAIGAGASKLRSRTFGATAAGCRTPTSDGSPAGADALAAHAAASTARCDAVRRIPPQPVDRATPTWTH